MMGLGGERRRDNDIVALGKHQSELIGLEELGNEWVGRRAHGA